MRHLLKKDVIIVSFIILIAAILRLISATTTGTFIYDEMFSVHFARMNLGEMLSFLKNDIHPPLYYILLNFWVHLFGDGHLTTRILSLLFSVASIPLLYSLTKKILNGWIAIFTILLFSISYSQIFIATEVRMYSLLVFLGLASLNLFWCIVVENKKRLWLLYIATTLAMMLVNLGSVFCLATQGLWFLLLIKNKQLDKLLIKKYLLSLVPILFGWLLWLVPYFIPQLIERLTKDWFFTAEINRSTALGIYNNFFLLLQSYWLRLITASIILVAPFMAILWSPKELKKESTGNLNPNWFLFALILPAFITSALLRINYTRIFSIAYLGFFMILAYMFYLLFKNHKKYFWILLVAWFAISGVALIQNFNQPTNDWQKTALWLQKNIKENDIIIQPCFINKIQFQNYLPNSLTSYGLYEPQDQRSLEEKIIKNSCYNTTDDHNIDELSNITKSSNHLFIIYNVQPPDDYLKNPLHSRLTKDNWSIIDSFDPETIFGPKILVYQRDN